VDLGEVPKINALDLQHLLAHPPLGASHNLITLFSLSLSLPPSTALFVFSADLRARLISTPPATVSDVSGRDDECRISDTARDMPNERVLEGAFFAHAYQR
jgi:hypothetical protein